MQTRRAQGIEIRAANNEGSAIFRVSEASNRPEPLRRKEGFVVREAVVPPGYAWYLAIGEAVENAVFPAEASVAYLPEAFSHIGDGDVVCISPERKSVNVLFQRNARHHAFLLTERCNNYCLMCSQPPRNVNDDYIFHNLMKVIPLVDPSTHEIGFTGGEPTLLDDKLVALIRQCQAYLPTTGLHVLTNGRAFSDPKFTQKFVGINHHDLMFGIPLYSDLSDRHDYVVQADGAFDETVRGILNLERHGLLVEIRVVVHKQTFDRLPQLARFIARNLTFIDQVVWMGLEMTGFTRANLEDLWIDPLDYQPQLVEAVEYLAASRIKTSVYNHQLCITDCRLWSFAKKSISDWKNEYMPECEGCEKRNECAGFFSSAKFRYSNHISPINSIGTGGMRCAPV